MAGIKFLGRVSLFLLPLIIFLGFPVFVLYEAKELMPDDQIALREASSTSPVTIGLGYSNPFAYVQLHAAILEKPTVLILGSSRIEGIREDFFDPGTSVYVAGGVVQKISYFRHFLEKIPLDQSPKVLVIGLDQKFFDPNYDSLAPDNIDSLLTKPLGPTDVLMNWSLVYRDYAQRKFSLSDLLHADDSRIGMSAIVHGAGFRNDGSYDPGPAIYTPPGLDPTLSYIDRGIVGFEYSDNVSVGALKELDALLNECHERNIHVVGFIPPFSPVVYQKLMSMDDKYGYMNKLSANINPLFDKYGFDFYNLADPGPLGITDKDMIDSLHVTERGSLIEFVKMAAESNALQKYTDPKTLAETLAVSTAETDLFKTGSK